MQDRPGTFPLTAAQEMMWEFMSALDPVDPGRSRLLVAQACRLLGPLDEVLLAAAVADVAGRHDMLRMVFDSTGPDPRMRISPDAVPALDVVDLSGLPEARRGPAVERRVAEDRSAAFDLRHGPLWRPVLFRLSEREHILVLTFFHMVSDGWSGQVFLADLGTAYRARLGAGGPLPGPELTHDEVVELQRRALTGRPDRAAFWRDRLTPLPAYQLFEAGEVAPGADLTAEVADAFTLEPEMARRLRRVAWRARSTPYVALLAAYQIMLALRTGRRRVVLGTTTLGRDSAVSRTLIGQFTNNVYVPAEIRPDATLRDVLAAAHHATTESIAHVASFHSVATAVDSSFARHRPWPDNHLFDAWFQSAAPAMPDLVLPGPAGEPELTVQDISVTPRPVPGAAPVVAAADVPADRLPVWLKRGAPIIVIDDDRCGGLLIRNRCVYPDALAAEIIADYLAVITALAGDPDQPVAGLTLPSRAPVPAGRP